MVHPPGHAQTPTHIQEQTASETERHPDRFSETGTDWMTFKWMEASAERMSSFPAFLSRFRPPSGYQTEIKMAERRLLRIVLFTAESYISASAALREIKVTGKQRL